MLAGFVAGEGSFIVTTRQPPHKDGTPRLRFVFQVAIADRDLALLERLREALGFGSIHLHQPKARHHQRQAILTIASVKAHRASTIPFFERILLPSAKRRQFELWRDALELWDSQRPSQYGKGSSACSVDGCEKPVRGRGLCRSHYYRATGY